jgi:hypothetical protein
MGCPVAQESGSNDLGEVIQGMSSEECASVWNGIKKMLPDTLAEASQVFHLLQPRYPHAA